MSAGSMERQTINLPGTMDQPKTEPDYLLDPRSTEALSELQDGDLLRMVRRPRILRAKLTEGQVVNHEEDIIEFEYYLKNVATDRLDIYIDGPGIKKFAFYRYPGSDVVILIWTRFPATASTKNARVQHRVRRDLIWYAEKAGIKNVATLEVRRWQDVTAERLQKAADSLKASKE
ncbi:actin-binding cofilin tropomyosin type [Fusarium pseudoanthophilum]|uniref:Actin-binding cofilin tropomyosin type n=1 Tax=Fusarium pseudoanthophilum TaxID=48495 RepID=A0A8H5NYE6_9HYPO|nr:actin-binding cofilin tropomyosin type [Fusarium pseudoanthophilum]